MLPEAQEVLKEKVYDLFEQSEVDILNVEGGGDRVHVLFRTRPTAQRSKAVNTMKGATGKHLGSRFPEPGVDDGSWSPACFLATTGPVTLDQLMAYVDEHAQDGDALCPPAP